MAQPDISSILAALANQNAGTPQAPTPQQQLPPGQGPPPGYPSNIPAQPPGAPPGGSYLPQPSNTGSVDLSSIKPVNSGSVSIADAIAKAKSIAADRGVAVHSPAQGSDPRLASRGYRQSRSRSPPRRSAYGSNPYRDERREDPRRGSHRRSPSDDRNMRGSKDPPEGYRSNDGETETIRVKSSLVGLIIGRNGENMRKIESDTGARVQFIQAKDTQVPERQCTISGNLRSRESAKAAIYGIIDENGGQNVMQEKGAYSAGQPGRAKVNLPALRDGELNTQIMVPDKTVGLIIGRAGETIKDLQEKSGCHVNILGENKSVNGLRPINLIGDDYATRMAKNLILEVVESDTRDGGGDQGSQPPGPPQRARSYDNQGYRGGQGGGGQGGRDHVEKTIQVPSEAVGMIIGKGGETIKDMQKTSGCKINVNQPKNPDINRDIDLAGSASAMAEAERVIWEKVETVQQRDAAAGRSHGGRGNNARQDGYSQQQPPAAASGYPSWMQSAQQGSQAPAQTPAFQMPGSQPAAQPQQPQSSEQDPYAAWGGQAAVFQWYAQQMANLGQQQQPGSGGAPGTQ